MRSKGQILLEEEAIARNIIMLMRIADRKARIYFKKKKGFFWKWRLKDDEFREKSYNIFKELEEEDKKYLDSEVKIWTKNKN